MRLDHQGTEKPPAEAHMVNKCKKVVFPSNWDEEVFVVSFIFHGKLDIFSLLAKKVKNL